MSPANHEQKHAERFEFSAARNAGVFVCTKVRDGAPAVHVSHDADGDWQFLHGGDEHGEGQSDAPLLMCLECVVADDLTLNEVSDLGENWTAECDHVGGIWRGSL